ncbi:DUF4386 domain-containing protein [Cognatilysobacter terrigena]|uniref:DUF4386 domain-containing protein n=1 Tax=Cognatilysobacter terrigena TaxID=2488749 RepID=UPI00105FA0E9|nr:DUF4386 domain-containing protein [Lysobacter terrigena]
MHTALPQRYARFAGLLYLLIIAAGAFGELAVRGSLVVAGDAAATASRIAAAPGLWRAGIGLDLLMHVCDVFVMWSLYVLLRPVSRNGARLVLLLNLVQTAVLVANKSLLLVPLFLLDPGAAYLKAFDATQLQGLSYAAIRLHEHGFGIGLVFFGFVLLVEGALVHRSGYLPRVLGAALQVAGVCYVVNSALMLLAPDLQGRLFAVLMLPCFLAETSFALWLLVRGVDRDGWARRTAPGAAIA